MRRQTPLGLVLGLIPATALTLALTPVAPPLPWPLDGHDVALKAGTIHLQDAGRVVAGGTILVQGGKITAVGPDVAVPPGVRVVDYGPDAVIVPGLVAVDTRFGSSIAAPRTAEPTLRAIDNFDPYTDLYSALAGGVTSAYLAPARGRLIAGQGAVVKTAGEPGAARVLRASTGLHGSIASEARNTPGYWEPPVPATVDVGLGYEQPQLPRTTMGAVIALRELVAYAQGEDLSGEYGRDTGPALAALMAEKATWRMGADTAGEVRALLDVFGENQLPLVIEGADGAADLAERIAAAGVPVIAAPDVRSTADFGKTPDSAWPRTDTIARLAAAGVEVAIEPTSFGPTLDLLFAAAAARRGGLDEGTALAAITTAPAKILGVADRVGSIAPGRDADFCVLSGEPFAAGTSVVATWVDGEVAWKAKETAAVVIRVDELHVGDGEVLAPGEILIQDGRIRAVGRSVGRPPGATVVRGHAAMPGAIDAFGYLGLEGSQKGFSTRFDLARIVEPGDYADRRVARAGVTTVNLVSRGNVGSGSPTMAYKPAGADPAEMVVKAPNALRLEWTQDIRTASGEQVKKALEKALEYKQKWEQYEKDIAAWTPPPPEKAADEEKADEGDEEKTEEGDEKSDEKSDKKKKKKKKEDLPPRPVTGVWEGEAKHPTDETRGLRVRLSDEDGRLEGNLRLAGLDELVLIEGTRAEYAVHLEGLSAMGVITLELTLGFDDEAERDTLTGKGTADEHEAEVTLSRTSDEYKVARRPERRRVEEEKPPKGMPKEPGIDPDLEPLRQAMLGQGAVIVTVTRDDEILDCVAEFERHGIRPLLFGADGAHEVADELRGRVAGVLLPGSVTVRDEKAGARERNRYAELSIAGLPVAFHSAAEEGAALLLDEARWAVARGMSATDALRGLTSAAASMLAIEGRVGTLAVGLDADVLLLDGAPMDPGTSVLRAWVSGREVR